MWPKLTGMLKTLKSLMQTMHLQYNLVRAYQLDGVESHRLYNALLIMVLMLSVIELAYTWTHRLIALLNKYHSVDPKKKGVIDDWQRQNIWL